MFKGGADPTNLDLPPPRYRVRSWQHPRPRLEKEGGNERPALVPSRGLPPWAGGARSLTPTTDSSLTR